MSSKIDANTGKRSTMIKNIYALGYDGENVFETWQYAGERDKEKLFRKIIEKENICMPPYEDKCLCNTKIKNNHFICDPTKTHILVVGSCCIKKFVVSGTQRHCNECNSVHKNTKDNYCNTCRKKSIIAKKQLEHEKIRQLIKQQNREAQDRRIAKQLEIQKQEREKEELQLQKELNEKKRKEQIILDYKKLSPIQKTLHDLKKHNKCCNC